MAKKLNTVPLIQTPRPDLWLRAENLYAFSRSGFGDVLNDPEKLDVLCLDDLPKSFPFPSHKFSLVDHNRLGSRFAKDNPNATVVSVIDHHADEKLYKDTANPRIITVPTGSCASLVADLINDQCPTEVALIPELATLLICSIVIDTSGLKPGGKAEDPDRRAMAYLLPRSTFVPALPTPVIDIGPGTHFNDIPVLKDLTKNLKTRKEDVSRLGTRDLLRRDFKECALTPSWAKDSQIRVGLTSVPVGFASWIPRDKDFYGTVEGLVKEQQLAALVILTSFDEEKESKKSEKKDKKDKKKDEKKGEKEDEKEDGKEDEKEDGKKKKDKKKDKKGDKKDGKEDKKDKKDKKTDKEKAKGKHKRQLLAVVADNKDLALKLFPGLEKNSELQLEERSFEKFGAKKATGDFGWVLQAKVYRQGNPDATRKTVAPIVMEVVEGPPNASL